MGHQNYLHCGAFFLLLTSVTLFGQSKSASSRAVAPPTSKSATINSTTAKPDSATQPIYKGGSALDMVGKMSEAYIKENGKNVPVATTAAPSPKATAKPLPQKPLPLAKPATAKVATPKNAPPTAKPAARSVVSNPTKATIKAASPKSTATTGSNFGGFDEVTGMQLEMPTVPSNFKVTNATSLGVFVEDTDVPTLTNGEKDQLIKIQRLLRSASYLDEFSGVVIVAKDFKPIWKHAGGYTNLDYGINTSLDARFNLCTITESLTATAILQLLQANKLDLQAPIKTYLPYLTNTGNLTIHQLLTHTTALPDYYQSLEYADNFFNIKSIDELVKQIDQQTTRLNTDAHAYNHSDYVLLGAIIEAVSGTAYKDYIYEKIIKPSAMDLSDLYSWFDVIENNAVGYSFSAVDSLKVKRRMVKKSKRTLENKAVFQSAEYWGAHPFGADGVYATGDDLIRFVKATVNNQLLDKTHTDLLFQNHSLNIANAPSDTTAEKYGYGWLTRTTNGQTVLYQGGTLDAISVQVRHYVQDNYTIVVLSNYYINRAESIADKIEKAIYNIDYIVPVEPIGYAINESINTDGLIQVINNFDKILKDKNLTLDKYVVLNKLGEEYIKEKNFLTAIEILKLNVRQFPNEPMVYDALADCYFKMGQYDNALKEYRKKLSLKANDPRATAMISHINTLQSKSK